MLGLIETNKRRITEPMVMNIWSALWRLHKAYEVPHGLETLVRLDEELDAMIVTERVTL